MTCRIRVSMLVVPALVLAAACAPAVDRQVADRKATQLVDTLQSRGLAPAMTEDVARSLYGDSGGSVCAALRDNPAGAILGWGRATLGAMPREQAQKLVEYDRAVVTVYCPDELPTFASLLASLNYPSPP